MSILKSGVSAGYRFMTFREFVAECPNTDQHRICLLRHDLDDKPQRLRLFLEAERIAGVRSTTFILVHTDKYNPHAYPLLKILREAERDGFEIGLHSNFLEAAKATGYNPETLLKNEVETLRGYFQISGVACHRNIDNMYNSLPYLEKNWPALRGLTGLTYHAYDAEIMNNLAFVNEGIMPLGWRSLTPEEVIASGRSFCLSTHPHWWHKDHAHED